MGVVNPCEKPANRLLVLFFTCVCLLACATFVQGSIPPAAFEFKNVVPISPREPGGWKVAKLKILLGRISPIFSMAAYCDIEVGIPELNLRGPVSDEFAQVEAAAAADEAARLALAENLPTSEVCRIFQAEMGRILSAAIPGVRVTKFLMPDVPYKSFP